jgi:4-aminobutyrate aminotransferase/(S)-3-amino-2-methylpropionate transaminase
MSSTYGGNPLSCAAALATIEVLLEEKLTENAVKVGSHILRRLREMQSSHELIGDVRGRGLMIGVELVQDRRTKKPAKEEAKKIISRIFQRRVLVVPSGWSNHVLRVAPPLIISTELADMALEVLDEEMRTVEHDESMCR